MRCLTILAVAILNGACGGAGVEVRNRSAARLDDIVISANGRSASIRTVESQAQGTTAICPKGEAGMLGFSFRRGGQSYHSEHSLYFECNSSYIIRIEVLPTLRVVATSSLE